MLIYDDKNWRIFHTLVLLQRKEWAWNVNRNLTFCFHKKPKAGEYSKPQPKVSDVLEIRSKRVYLSMSGVKGQNKEKQTSLVSVKHIDWLAVLLSIAHPSWEKLNMILCYQSILWCVVCTIVYLRILCFFECPCPDNYVSYAIIKKQQSCVTDISKDKSILAIKAHIWELT